MQSQTKELNKVLTTLKNRKRYLHVTPETFNGNVEVYNFAMGDFFACINWGLQNKELVKHKDREIYHFLLEYESGKII